MKSIKNERLETYQEKKNLEKKLEKSQRKRFGVSERECLGDEQVRTDR